MMMNNNSENYQIIGFDLGHGKTALAKVMSSNGAEPEIMEIQKEKFQITAIAYDQGGLPIIGDAAFETAKNYSEVKEFEISFKQRVSKNPKFSEQTIINFVKAVYLKLEKSEQLDTQIKQHFFIGCPSGWKDKDQDNYKKLMLKAGLYNVVVTPESRAAFMHALENDKFTIEEIQKGILVIDIGSSTTDFTFVYDSICQDYGEHNYDLGASLIEKEILNFAIENHTNKDKIKKHFEENKLDKKVCEISCRKEVKEKYFKNPFLYESNSIKYEKKLQRGLYFEVEINGATIKDIINKSLYELGDNSWKQAFRNQLTEIKNKFDKKSIKPSKILLTGGGARMNFIQEICKEVFPSSPYQMDTEPELCIARGLARWGRLSVNTTQFEEEINQFIHGNLRNIVKKYFDNYLDKLVDFLTDGLLNEVIKPSLKDFRSGEIKNKKDLESKIQQRGKQWLQDSDVQKKRTEPILKKQVKDLEKEVQTKIDLICQNYGLERGTFGIQSEHPINFNLDLSKLNDINAGVQSLSKEDLPTIQSSILLGSAAYIATILLITDAAVEVILAPFTAGLSVILGVIFFPLFNKHGRKKSLTDDKIEEIIRDKKSEFKENIKQQLGNRTEDLLKILEVTTEAIETGIKEKIDDVRILLH